MTRAAKYRTIVADPPWDHSDGTGVDIRNGGRITHLPYPTMALEAIADLPVRDLADSISDLYLWTTSRYLYDTPTIARRWGFTPAATLVWCKPSRGWSTGGSFQNNVEFCLFCRRHETRHINDFLRAQVRMAGLKPRDVDAAMGTRRMAQVWWLDKSYARVPLIEQWHQLKSIIGFGDEMDAEVARLNALKGEGRQAATSRWFTWGRGAHSAKPEAFLDMVEQVSPGPYLEIFARRQRLGWDTWGNEALEHVEMPA